MFHVHFLISQGSGATEDCCSKCFLENQKKQSAQAVPLKQTKQPLPMQVDNEFCREIVQEPNPVPVLKKKKKTSYKAMMSAMTSVKEKDIEKEKESIRQATGGGAFSKIDKI